MKNLREVGSKNLIVKCYHANYSTAPFSFMLHSFFAMIMRIWICVSNMWCHEEKTKNTSQNERRPIQQDVSGIANIDNTQHLDSICYGIEVFLCISKVLDALGGTR